MKFTINARTFASALAQQLRVINAKNALAILDNFKLELFEDRLLITASDPEITSVIAIEPKTIDIQGSLCINASKLTDIVRKFGDKDMTFERHENANSSTITCGKGVYTLPALEVDEYPMRNIPEDGYFTLPTSSLMEGINITKGAASTDSLRPMLCGVFMNVDANGIDFVASDTHQLIVCKTEGGMEEPKSVIIPIKTANLVLNLFAKYQDVRICITNNNVTFKTDTALLSSTLQKGNYPNYNRVIPTESPVNVKVNRKELLDVINRVSGFASTSTNLIVLEEGGMMEMKVSAKDYDSAQTAEDYIMSDGTMGNIRIGLSSGYLSQVLNVFNEDEITLRFIDASRPLKIQENNVTAILMPIQIIE